MIAATETIERNDAGQFVSRPGPGRPSKKLNCETVIAAILSRKRASCLRRTFRLGAVVIDADVAERARFRRPCTDVASGRNRVTPRPCGGSFRGPRRV